MGCCNSYFQESEVVFNHEELGKCLKSPAGFSTHPQNRSSIESTKEILVFQDADHQNHGNPVISPVSHLKTLELPEDSSDMSLDSWNQAKDFLEVFQY
jgi:hypothetical protein